MLRYLLYLLLIIVLMFIIIPIIWCYNPSIILNTKYKVISDLKIESVEEPSLFICSHLRTTLTYDQIIMLTEVLKNKNKFNVVSERAGNRLLEFLKNLPKFAKYSLMKTDDKNIVKKSIDLIKNKKENVLFFLTEGSKGRGLYYILKDLKIPIFIVKVREVDGIKSNYPSFNREFSLEYKKIENYNLNKEPEKFIEFLKEKLYE